MKLKDLSIVRVKFAKMKLIRAKFKRKINAFTINTPDSRSYIFLELMFIIPIFSIYGIEKSSLLRTNFVDSEIYRGCR